MNKQENIDGLQQIDKSFLKYGLSVNKDGSIQGPKRPSLYARTPDILQSGYGEFILEQNREFLERVFNGKQFSVPDEKEQLEGIVGKVFKSATDRDLSDYVKFIYMERYDWKQFRSKIRGNTDEERNYDAIHLGGLVVVGAEGDDRIFPLLFHETGHALYPPSDDRIIDELRAYYFQRVTTRIFERQLTKFGIQKAYPDYDEDHLFPSREHKLAYQTANALYSYRSVPALQEDDGSSYSQRMKKALSLVTPIKN